MFIFQARFVQNKKKSNERQSERVFKLNRMKENKLDIGKKIITKK
jgi:hypothetical protein